MAWGDAPPAVEMPLPSETSDVRFVVTPSNVNSWRAHRVEGEWYTHAQRREMRQRGLDPNTVETIVVRSVTGPREYWVPEGQRYPIYVITCPVVGRKPDGSRIQVICPRGWLEWVGDDGSLGNRRWAK